MRPCRSCPDQGEPPKVSVIMPVKDAEQYVGAAVRSMLEQTYSHFELLVIDDGSTDSSRSIVEGFPDPRVRVLTNAASQGIAAALNRGIDNARGELIARMDADDISMPNRLARQVRYMEEHPDVVLLGTRVAFIGGPLGMIDVRPVEKGPSAGFLAFGTPVVHPTAMVRLPVLERHGLRYSREYSRSEDYELWTRLVAHGAVANLAEVLLQYRLHIHSVTSQDGKVMAAQHETIMRDMLRGYSIHLADDDFALLSDVVACRQAGSLPGYFNAARVLNKMVEESSMEKRDMRDAAAVAFLRYSCGNAHLGIPLWQVYRSSGLIAAVPGALRTRLFLLLRCVWHTLKTRTVRS